MKCYLHSSVFLDNTAHSCQGVRNRWGDGGNGPGSSFRMQWAGIHKAALADYTVAGSTTVGLIWTGGFNDQMFWYNKASTFAGQS